jgi:catechol 2,3-dioxygenase
MCAAALAHIMAGEPDEETTSMDDHRGEPLTGQGYGIAPHPFRLPSATRLGSVDLQVSSLERAVGYYRDLLGMRVLSQTLDTAALGAHGDTRPLVRLHAGSGVRPALPGRALGLYHFALLLPDRAALGAFVTHLAERGTAAGMADHLVSEAVYLQDPDGLGIEVYADRPRAQWRQQGRELAMTTLPLDVRSVVAAAGAPWHGMPAGSVLGHVHLHVGDLAEAEAFYHGALGLDKVVWSYPGALFLSAGGYHHHLAVNTWVSGPPPADDQARLLSWDIVVPSSRDAGAVRRSLEAAGHPMRETPGGWTTADPWGTPLRIVAAAPVGG